MHSQLPPDEAVEVAARARVGRQDDQRAGGVGGRLLAAGDRHLPRLERLAHRLDDVGAEVRELVEEQHAVVREADLSRPHPPGAASEHARRGRRVVRGEPRWTAHQPASIREDAGDGVQRRDLERLLGRQVGQDRRDALGDRRLAGPAGPDQHRGMAARRGDLDGVPDVLEPVEVAQVDVGQAVLAAPGRQRAGRGADDRVCLGHLDATEHGGHLGQRADAEDRHPRARGRPRRPAARARRRA